MAERQGRWHAAGISWQIVRSDLPPKAGASLRAESPARVAELLIWESGEADLIHAELEPRVTDPIVDHYDLTTLLGLDGCLDDFECHMGIRR